MGPAFEAWCDVDTEALGPDDLHSLATAAFLLGKHDECVAAIQKAFQPTSIAPSWRGPRAARGG